MWINRISILTQAPIYPGRTLLFLDEIQESPRAITALRYFYEKMPSLHVIGAGSLVEFTLGSEDFRMPVGRIQSMYMFPMSFEEFITALGEKKLCAYLNHVDLKTGIEEAFADFQGVSLSLLCAIGGTRSLGAGSFASS